MAYKAVVLAALGSVALVGCGGDSGSGSSSFSKFSTSDFTKLVNSADITGTWVMIANGSSKSVESDGYWAEQDFSRKSFLVIKNVNDQYFISSCTSGFDSITYSSVENIIGLNIPNGSSLTVQDNNYISGSVNTTSNDGDYNQYDFEYVKVSDSVLGLGKLNADWSGTATSTDTTDDIFALCLESISEVDSDRDTSVYLEADIGIQPYDRKVALVKGSFYGESEESVFISGGSDTISESAYWNGNASVEYSQTASTFTATASATESSGESVSITINASLP